MRTGLAFCLLILLGSAICYEDVIKCDNHSNFPCTGFKYEAGSFFHFNSLPKKEITVQIEKMTFEGQEYKGTAVYAFCTAVSKPELDEECDKMAKEQEITLPEGDYVGYLKLYDINDNSIIKKCIPLSNEDKTKNKWSIESDHTEKGGWIIELKESENPIKPSWNLKCGTTNELSELGATFDDSTSTLKFTATSKNACAYTSGRLVMLLASHWIFACIVIPISLFMIFFGQKFIKTVLFLMGMLFGIVLTLTLSQIVSNYVSWKTWVYFLVTGLSILFGILFGWVFQKLTKFYLVIAGGFLGYALSFKAFEFYNLATGHSSDTIQFVIIIVLICLGAVFGYFIHDHVLILSTAFGGSLILCIMVGVLLKNYPDLDNINNFNSLGEETRKKFLVSFIAYTLAWLFIAILGAVVQYKHRKENMEKGEQGFSDNKNGTDYNSFEYYGYCYNAPGSKTSHYI